MTDGIILIDKPSGMTSFGVVARVRRILTVRNGKKTKVGHTGTLDPFATGLMILTVGKECKNAMNYSKLDKSYRTKIKLGFNSTTGDTEGEITSVSNKIPTKEEVQQVLNDFTGKIEQTPPKFSAIKINGQRAYKLAREGKEVEMPKRQVEIYKIELLGYKYPYIEIEVSVSSGTYIRTLAEDVGTKLKTGAYCEELKRLSIDKWTLSEATTLKSFMENY
ncbi:tRNA pseudouridine(55) synthase TruB [Candidatus Saccharibacteria bacterium]|nr:tRNA pseudouridine(55) synthase TruB [Candidatus Saccharibacteria bacterium]MBP9986166.1 tRNA pseudouridine(55) synthase TruB [Candidatus Saccharibacteria bacterium]